MCVANGIAPNQTRATARNPRRSRSPPALPPNLSLLSQAVEIKLRREHEQIRRHSRRQIHRRRRIADRREHRFAIGHANRNRRAHRMAHEHRRARIDLAGANQSFHRSRCAQPRARKCKCVAIVAMAGKIQGVSPQAMPREVFAQVGHHPAIRGEPVKHDRRSGRSHIRRRVILGDRNAAAARLEHEILSRQFPAPNPRRSQQQANRSPDRECKLPGFIASSLRF